MKRTDVFLIGIVGAVLALAAIALVVALVQPKPSYQSEDTPGGVVGNYLLAVQLGDYARAYGYLAPDLPGYPQSVAEFTQELLDEPGSSYYRDGDTTFAVELARLRGDEAATVVVARTVYYRNLGLFDRGSYTARYDVQLKRVGGAWKIRDAVYVWNGCWTTPGRPWCND